MAAPEFLFGIGSGIRQDLSPELILKGAFFGAFKNVVFNLSDLNKESKARQTNFDTSRFVSPESEISDIKSYLGTPVFDPLIIKGGTFIEPNQSGGGDLVQYAGGPGGDGFLINNVIIEVTQTKNIIATAIQGKPGTIKEFISDGDFAVTLTGVLNGENENGKIVDIGNNYPRRDTELLIQICKVPAALSITSSFLQLFSSDFNPAFKWVVTDYSIPQREGFRDIQPFQISLLSDIEINLTEVIDV